MKYCYKCAKELFDEAEVCPNCGVRQHTPSTTGSPNRVTAALLAIFLGGFGIHRFYMRKPISGVLYLIFCWTFIPSIIALVEFIVYLCQTDEGFAKHYAS